MLVVADKFVFPCFVRGRSTPQPSSSAWRRRRRRHRRVSEKSRAAGAHLVSQSCSRLGHCAARLSNGKRSIRRAPTNGKQTIRRARAPKNEKKTIRRARAPASPTKRTGLSNTVSVVVGGGVVASGSTVAPGASVVAVVVVSVVKHWHQTDQKRINQSINAHTHTHTHTHTWATARSLAHEQPTTSACLLYTSPSPRPRD